MATAIHEDDSASESSSYTWEGGSDDGGEDGDAGAVALDEMERCVVCGESVFRQSPFVCGRCCGAVHLVCLARSMLEERGEWNARLLPDGGTCPSCDVRLEWGQVLRSLQ